jgi:hypothetical protein
LCEGHPEKFVDVKKYEEAKKKLKIHLKVLKKAKIDLSKNNWYNLVPEGILLDYLNTKNKLIEELSKFPKTENYKIILSLMPVLEDIKKRKVCEDRVIKYLPFKTKTGRLTTGEGSFPILNLRKEARRMLVSKNDFFVSLDYNAVDVRVFLALCGIDQPEIDIHDYHCRLFNIESREEAKKRFFRWLYNPEVVDEILEERYDKKEILGKYYQNGIITTPFGKQITGDDYHALSYLVQSTAASIFYEQVVKVSERLKEKKSEIVFLLHDEIVIDTSIEDVEIMKEIKEIYSNTRYGKFLVRMKGGKNLGEMKNEN